MSTHEAASLFEQVSEADDEAMQEVRHVGGEEVEGNVAESRGGRDVTALVVEANIAVTRQLHAKPVGLNDLRKEENEGGMIEVVQR